MTKPLSEMLEAMEPNETSGILGNPNFYCDRESYDRMTAIAIELAKACEKINIHCQAITISSWRETRLKFTNINNEAISKARAMLKGENNE